MTVPATERGAITFAEKVLELLDEGRYTATYKYAVLLALMDLCLEKADRTGTPPSVLTTRELAERIIDLYWPHTVPYGGRLPAQVLRQNVGGQAEIVSAIAAFRQRSAPDAASAWHARLQAPRQFERLTRTIEWKLIQMPLPRLQTVGAVTDEFIYTIHWTHAVRQREVRAHWEKRAGTFDNRVILKPGVGEYFRDLNGLLRPLIHRKWAAMVAALNRLPEAELETFLFAHLRTSTAAVRNDLWQVQERRCFYCEHSIADPRTSVVDHFVPWSRYPDNGVDNLVVADSRCNAWKSASLAAAEHVKRWAVRFVPGAPMAAALGDIVAATGWPRDTHRTLGVSRSIYLALPDTARLWVRGKEFAVPDRPAIRAALSGVA